MLSITVSLVFDVISLLGNTIHVDVICSDTDNNVKKMATTRSASRLNIHVWKVSLRGRIQLTWSRFLRRCHLQATVGRLLLPVSWLLLLVNYSEVHQQSTEDEQSAVETLITTCVPVFRTHRGRSKTKRQIYQVDQKNGQNLQKFTNSGIRWHRNDDIGLSVWMVSMSSWWWHL